MADDRPGALSRRRLLQAGVALPFLASSGSRSAHAQTASPPILFVHGNGDMAPIWMTSIWRMESNGIARERLAAINFTDPLARRDDAVAQANTSSTEDQKRELADAITSLKQRLGVSQVALVANSRGGNAVRNYLKGSAQDVSHAVLCGVPCHGIFDWDDMAGSEFNARSPFLRRLNDGGESEITQNTQWLTLRSDAFDKYAQPDGRFVGKPGVPTNISFDGPALRGATNLVLPGRDHREVAFHREAFREIHRFITGRYPQTDRVTAVPEVRLSGQVTGTPGGVPTNRPVAGAMVEIWRTDPATGSRIGEAVLSVRTAADGAWGPAIVAPDWPLEFVLTVPDAPVTHTYRSPFPRSSDIVHLRAARPLAPTETSDACIVRMSRPTGYFGLPRDVVQLDGRAPTDVKTGVPTDSVTSVRPAAADAGRTVIGQFNEERIAAKAWPASENRVSIIELTY